MSALFGSTIFFCELTHVCVKASSFGRHDSQLLVTVAIVTVAILTVAILTVAIVTVTIVTVAIVTVAIVTVATLMSAFAARHCIHVVQASTGTVYPVVVVRGEHRVAGYERLVASKRC